MFKYQPVRNLGIIIDTNLNFKYHIDIISKSQATHCIIIIII